MAVGKNIGPMLKLNATKIYNKKMLIFLMAIMMTTFSARYPMRVEANMTIVGKVEYVSHLYEEANVRFVHNNDHLSLKIYLGLKSYGQKIIF